MPRAAVCHAQPCATHHLAFTHLAVTMLCSICNAKPCTIQVFCSECLSSASGVTVKPCTFCERVLYGDIACTNPICIHHHDVLQDENASHEEMMEAEKASIIASVQHTGKKRAMVLEANNTTNDDKQCSVCLDSIKDSNVALMCGHVFHDDCINGWIQTCNDEAKVSACPECRTKIVPQIVID